MKFLDSMFKARGYDMSSKRVLFFKKKRLWEIFIDDESGGKVLCVLTTVCSSNSDHLNIEEFTPENPSEEEDDTTNTMFEGAKSNSNKGNKVGMDFIKSIIAYGIKNNVKLVILISDSVTNHAIRAICNSKINIVNFTYMETAISRMSKHVNQPLVFKKLSSGEKDIYIKENPNYETELTRYSADDPLVKYFGIEMGDLVRYQDNDRQSGLVRETGIVVRAL